MCHWLLVKGIALRVKRDERLPRSHLAAAPPPQRMLERRRRYQQADQLYSGVLRGRVRHLTSYPRVDSSAYSVDYTHSCSSKRLKRAVSYTHLTLPTNR